jgi:hypothetical protein
MKDEQNKMKPEELGAYYESILEREVRKEKGIFKCLCVLARNVNVFLYTVYKIVWE